MHPILFEIPGLEFPIRTFGLMVVIGFLVGSSVLSKLATRYAGDPEADAAGYQALPIWLLLGILLGARMLYVIVEVGQGSEVGQSYLDSPLKIFAYWEGGLVMYGGVFGAVIGGWWCARKHKLSYSHAIDMGVVSSMVGLGLGRIGCLMVGDDFGSIVPEAYAGLPFPIILHVPEVLKPDSLFGEANAGQVLWATQVWMSLNAFFLAYIGYRILKGRRYVGQAALWTGVFYAITRATIEVFRGDKIRGLWFNDTLSTSQLISIVLLIVCGVLLYKNRSLRSEDPAPAP